MSEVKVIDPKEFGLEESKGTELTTGLDVTLKERISLIQEFDKVSVMDVETTDSDVFKTLRLKIRDNRTKGIEKWHKASKAYFLHGGKFVDAIKNKEVDINEKMESVLLKGEKHQEKLEAERITKLDESRALEITPFLPEGSPEPVSLGSMTDDIWGNYLSGVKSSYDLRIKAEKEAEEARIAEEKKAEDLRIKQEKEAEEKRKAELAEQVRVKKENDRLKKEADQKEADRLAELKKIEDKAKNEQKERERLAKIEADKQAKIKADLEAKAEEEKQARLKSEAEAQKKADKLKAELKAKEDAEKVERERLAKIEADQKEAYRLASLAPEKEKIQKWIDSIDLPIIDIANFSKEGKAVTDVINDKFNAFKKWAESQKETIK
jgi:DNA repair exonuclease SbcCD ATPase subunit